MWYLNPPNSSGSQLMFTNQLLLKFLFITPVHSWCSQLNCCKQLLFATHVHNWIIFSTFSPNHFLTCWPQLLFKSFFGNFFTIFNHDFYSRFLFKIFISNSRSQQLLKGSRTLVRPDISSNGQKVELMSGRTKVLQLFWQFFLSSAFDP